MLTALEQTYVKIGRLYAQSMEFSERVHKYLDILEFAEFSDVLEFADGKRSKPTCTAGTSHFCTGLDRAGGACVSAGKQCQTGMEGAEKTAADYVGKNTAGKPDNKKESGDSDAVVTSPKRPEFRKEMTRWNEEANKRDDATPGDEKIRDLMSHTDMLSNVTGASKTVAVKGKDGETKVALIMEDDDRGGMGIYGMAANPSKPSDASTEKAKREAVLEAIRYTAESDVAQHLIAEPPKGDEKLFADLGFKKHPRFKSFVQLDAKDVTAMADSLPGRSVTLATERASGGKGKKIAEPTRTSSSGLAVSRPKFSEIRDDLREWDVAANRAKRQDPENPILSDSAGVIGTLRDSGTQGFVAIRDADGKAQGISQMEKYDDPKENAVSVNVAVNPATLANSPERAKQIEAEAYVEAARYSQEIGLKGKVLGFSTDDANTKFLEGLGFKKAGEDSDATHVLESKEAQALIDRS
jgi:hypothetical protein